VIVGECINLYAQDGDRAFVLSSTNLCSGIKILCGHHDDKVQALCVKAMTTLTHLSTKRSVDLYTQFADAGLFEALLQLISKNTVVVKLGAMTVVAQLTSVDSESTRRLSLLGAVHSVTAASSCLDGSGQSSGINESKLREQAVVALHNISALQQSHDSFLQNDNYKTIISLLQRRESYMREAAEILTRVFPEDSDIHRLSAEILSDPAPADATASLQQDVQALKLKILEEKEMCKGTRQQVAAQAASGFMATLKFRVKEATFQDWCRSTWDGKLKRGKRNLQLRHVIQVIRNRDSYHCFQSLKANYAKATAGNLVDNAAVEQLQSELDAIKALASTADARQVMQLESKLKASDESLQKVRAEQMKLEQELSDARADNGDAKKSSFAQKMLALKKENKELTERIAQFGADAEAILQEPKAEIKRLEGQLAEAMAEEDSLRQQLMEASAVKSNRSENVEMPDGTAERIQELEVKLQQTTAALKKSEEECKANEDSVDSETAALLVLLENRLFSLEEAADEALHCVSVSRHQPASHLGGEANVHQADSSDNDKTVYDLKHQMATMKTKYQSNVARLQVDRQKMKQTLEDQKMMFSKQMAAIRDGFVKAMDEKDQEVLTERATLQAALRGNPHAAVCYYLSDGDD